MDQHDQAPNPFNADQISQEIPTSDSEENSQLSLPVKNGRPLKYKNREELQELVDKYFETETIWTMSGLARSLGLSRVSLLAYKNRAGYGQVILDAKARVEEFVEKKLFGPCVTGAIFNLANNFQDWHQKQQQDLNIGGQASNPVKINVIFPDKKVSDVTQD